MTQKCPKSASDNKTDIKLGMSRNLEYRIDFTDFQNQQAEIGKKFAGD